MELYPRLWGTDVTIVYWFYIRLCYVIISSLQHQPHPQRQPSRVRSLNAETFLRLPITVDHEQDWQPYPIDPYSAISDGHIYIHAVALYTVVNVTIDSDSQIIIRVLESDPRPNREGSLE